MKKKITHLDCTLRDGGYYNNWNFDIELVQEYLGVMSNLNIDYVEIGFRSFNANEYKGPFFYTTDDFLKDLKITKNIKISVMVNAADLIANKININDISSKRLFLKKKKSKVDLVRIACHFEEVNKIVNEIKWLKSVGYKVGLNLMQIADKSKLQIQNISKLASKLKTDVFYFADSMGSLNQKTTSDIIKHIKKYYKRDIGIHAHDNMGLALHNTLEASKKGVKWLDSTVMGMGRGPGNAKTEYLILEINKRLNLKTDYFSLLNFIEKKFNSLFENYKWGSNPFYYLAGIHNIHPSFIQVMLGDNRFAPLEMLSIVENLKNDGGKKFSKDILEMKRENYIGASKGTWYPIKTINKRDVLIIGSGPSSKTHAQAIERFIKKIKPYVIALNTKNSINQKLINARAACHTFRLLTEYKDYKNLQQPLILPYSNLSKSIREKLKNIKKYNFGIKVSKNIFKFEKNFAIIPNYLAFSYVLAVANSAKSKQIFLAGFDGYPADDPRRVEMDELINLYNTNEDVAKLISITPTKYKITSSSVYNY